MSKNKELERTCPECEEEMHPRYNKDKKLVCWECTECGKQEKP